MSRMELGPALETERLLLRPPDESDWEGYVAMQCDPEVMRWMGGAVDRSGAWRLLALCIGAWVMRGYGFFSVSKKADGRFVGRVGPWNPGDDWPATEVGWVLVRSEWGKGYAFEAAEAVMDWCARDLGWAELGHVIDHRNTASIRLAQRLGARKLRPVERMPGVAFEPQCDVWGQTAEEWLARRAVQ